MGVLVLLVFNNRYLVGAWLRWRNKWYPQPARPTGPLPTVAVVVPMYNEGVSIQRTIASLLGLNYPREKLDIVVVDDCSRDDSLAWAQRAAAGHSQVHVLQNAVNVGKRCSINHAVEQSAAEIILSVDSDVEVEPDALMILVSGFTEPDVAAVGGRVMVRNANVNWLTRMQAIKYYFGYLYLKNIERACDAVLCLVWMPYRLPTPRLAGVGAHFGRPKAAGPSHQIRRRPLFDPPDPQGGLSHSAAFDRPVQHRGAAQTRRLPSATTALASIEYGGFSWRRHPRVEAATMGCLALRVGGGAALGLPVGGFSPYYR